MKYGISLTLIFLSCVLAAVACFKKKSGIGGRLSHAGAAVILLGYCLSFLSAAKASFTVYKSEKSSIREIIDSGGMNRNAGFYFMLEDFNTAGNRPAAEFKNLHDDGKSAVGTAAGSFISELMTGFPRNL